MHPCSRSLFGASLIQPPPEQALQNLDIFIIKPVSGPQQQIHKALFPRLRQPSVKLKVGHTMPAFRKTRDQHIRYRTSMSRDMYRALHGLTQAGNYLGRIDNAITTKILERAKRGAFANQTQRNPCIAS